MVVFVILVLKSVATNNLVLLLVRWQRPQYLFTANENIKLNLSMFETLS